ncbi:MAG: hypothetical protein KAW12_07295 [Candidatus Aminicenantes bacterium]|nr:hypothetical protein [Candidatus Aminicenantes bacterium]
MAGKKISELFLIPAIAGDDVFPVVDISSDTTKKVAFSNLTACIAPNMVGTEGITISNDTITITSQCPIVLVTIDTEGGAATDDLKQINCSIIGQFLILQIANNDHIVTIKDRAVEGKIYGMGDFTFATKRSKYVCVYVDGRTDEISRSANA